MARIILSCVIMLIIVPYGITTSTKLTTETRTAASVAESLHSPTILSDQWTCQDHNLQNVISLAVSYYPSNVTAIAYYIRNFLSSNSMYRNSEFTILVDKLQRSSDWATTRILNPPNYFCTYSNYPLSWYINIVGITNRCSNNDEDAAPVPSFVLEKDLPLNSSRTGAVQPQAKYYEYFCQDPYLLNAVQNAIIQTSNVSAISTMISDFMIAKYGIPGLCKNFMVEVVKDYVSAYSLPYTNVKRFCRLFTDLWTITVVSDTCSLSQNQITTTTTTTPKPTTTFNSLCPDQNIHNVINYAVTYYSSNTSAIASYIRAFLSSNSMYRNSDYTILVDKLQGSSRLDALRILGTPNYLCLYTITSLWYIGVVGIANRCTNDDKGFAPVSSFVLEKDLPLNSSRTGAVQPQAKYYNTICQDSALLSTIQNTINQYSDATTVAQYLSDYMITKYRTPGLCKNYVVQVVKNYVSAYSYPSINAKRFCLLFTDQWTITVVSDTCSLPLNQITTTTPTATTKPTTPITSKPSSGNKQGVPSLGLFIITIFAYLCYVSSM